MDYQQLTKAELIENLEFLTQYVEELEKDTIKHKWTVFKKEADLLTKDLIKLSRTVYELGVSAGTWARTQYAAIKN